LVDATRAADLIVAAQALVRTWLAYLERQIER